MAKADSPKAKTAAAGEGNERAEPKLLLTDEEVERAVDRLVANADERRPAGLSTLELVRRARVQGLRREVDRLESREDPRARPVAEALAATEHVAQQLLVEARRAQVPTPAPREGAATVHGHVLDHRLEPVAGADVHLVDEKGKRVRGVGASTDAEGHFELEWSAPAAKRGGPEPEARLRVTTGKARVLHQEPKPRPWTAGAVEYTEIVVEESS